MEIWDVYDRERIKTGRTMQRGEVFKEGDYHLVVLIAIFNSKGELLIQQRQPFKNGWPDKWDITVGGSAVHRETSSMAAEREVYEEIGLKLDLHNVRPHMTVNFDYGFTDVYLLQREVDLDQLSLQKEEVKDVKWATKEEVLVMIDDGQFIPYHSCLIELFFDSYSYFGCHNHSK